MTLGWLSDFGWMGRGGGHLREEKQHKAEPADVRNKSLSWVKGLCLVTEKYSLAEPDGTRLQENLESPGEELSGFCNVDHGETMQVLEQRCAIMFKRKSLPLCLET